MTTSTSKSPRFTIHYFAAASTYTTKNTELLPAPLRLADLFPELERRYPGIREKVLISCAVSLNGGYVDQNESGDSGLGGEGDVVIGDGDEVAIIPPVSSG
jgi:molybdopterin converting factor small subunit